MALDFDREFEYFLHRAYLNIKLFAVYRTQALLWFLSSFIQVATSFFAISVVYGVSSGIAGWSYYEMLLLAATTGMFAGIFSYLVAPWRIVRRMIKGDLDQHLIRPYNRFNILMCLALTPSSFGGIFAGFVVFAFAATHLEFSVGSMLLYWILFAFGTIAMVSFGMMLTLISYNLLKSGNFINRLLGFSNTVGTYPLSVYGWAGQMFFSVVIPFGLAYYYPVTAFLGELPLKTAILVIAASILIAVGSYFGFDKLIKSYTSGGG